MRKSGNGTSNRDEDVDAQLAARLAKLTGVPDFSASSPSSTSSAKKIRHIDRSETDLVDEILSQAMDESILDRKHQHIAEVSLMERLSKLKAHGAVPAFQSTPNPPSLVGKKVPTTSAVSASSSCLL